MYGKLPTETTDPNAQEILVSTAHNWEAPRLQVGRRPRRDVAGAVPQVNLGASNRDGTKHSYVVFSAVVALIAPTLLLAQDKSAVLENCKLKAIELVQNSGEYNGASGSMSSPCMIAAGYRIDPTKEFCLLMDGQRWTFASYPAELLALTSASAILNAKAFAPCECFCPR